MCIIYFSNQEDMLVLNANFTYSKLKGLKTSRLSEVMNTDEQYPIT